MLPLDGVEGVYIVNPTVGTVPGVGATVVVTPVGNNVCMKLSGNGGSNLGITGVSDSPAGLGAPMKSDSGREDDTPCTVVRPGTEDGGRVPSIGICGCGAVIGLIVVGSPPDKRGAIGTSPADSCRRCGTRGKMHACHSPRILVDVIKIKASRHV